MDRRSFIQLGASALGLFGIGKASTPMSEPKSVIVTAKEFRAWLQTFMVYGSDQKVAICDVSSFNEISKLVTKCENGFRVGTRSRFENGQHVTCAGNEEWIMTPFGWLTIRRDETAAEITVIDPPVRLRRELGLVNQAYLEKCTESAHPSIKEIRV